MRSFGVLSGDIRPIVRPTVFGIAEQRGLIAVVAVRSTGFGAYYDLPGGGVEPGESEEEALTREFQEETGMIVKPVRWLTSAGQYITRSGGTTHNYDVGGVWTVNVLNATGAPLDDTHRLRWLQPVEAMASFRKDSHVEFVKAWLRWPGRSQQHHPRLQAHKEFKRHRGGDGASFPGTT